MAIKGITTLDASYPLIGKLRKGAKKPGNAPGKDLTYFRFDSQDLKAIEDFAKHYGEQPTEINVFLPYPTTEENFFTAKESYVASGLRSRCDGETLSALRQGNVVQRQFASPMPCPGKDFCKDCKPVGRLKCIIPELQRFAYVTAETHSVHDIANLYQQLRAVEGTFGRLNSIPFVLRRRPQTISVPKQGSSDRMRVEKWLLSIEIDPGWASLQLEAAKNVQMEQARVYQRLGGMQPSIAYLPAAVDEESEAEFEVYEDYTQNETWIKFQRAVSDAIRQGDLKAVDKMARAAIRRIDEGVLPGSARQGVMREWDRAIEVIASTPSSEPITVYAGDADE